MRIDYILIQTFCHATEDEKKVLKAVERLYPSFSKSTAKGYFKNPIHIFEAHIKRKRETESVISLLQENLGSELKNGLSRRVDKKGNIYIRLDKQELYCGRYVLKNSGEVKITVHMQFHPSEGKDAIDHAEEVFGN